MIVTQYFWPENFRINELADALAARGHHVTVLTSVPNYPSGKAHPAFVANPRAFARRGAVEIVRVPQVTRGHSRLGLVLNYLSFAIFASLLGPWHLRGRSFDAVFVFQTSPVTVGIPGAIMARLKNAPLLMWILDCWPETLAAIGVGGPRLHRMVEMLVRAIYRRCDLLLGQSRGFAANVARYGDAKRFRHFPNWVEQTYIGDLASSGTVPKAEAGEFTLMYAGNIGKAQDFPTVIAAMDALRDAPVRLVIVGEGRDAQRTRADVEERGLIRSVVFLGQKPAESMPGILADADALLVSLRPSPLFAMTVPGKVQTYLASAKPIIAMLDGEGASVLRESNSGIAVKAGDAIALAQAVRAMIARPAMERAAMGRAGVDFARTNYHLPTLVDRLEGWIAQLQSRRQA